MASISFGKMCVSALIRFPRLLTREKVRHHSICVSRQIVDDRDFGVKRVSSRSPSHARHALTQFYTYGTGSAGLNRNLVFNVNSTTMSTVFPTFIGGHHVRNFSTSQRRHKKEEITVNFLNRDGETFTVKAKVGESLLDTVIDNDVDIDGFGACEGTLACSTCHLLFDEEIFEMLPEKLDEEEDMLDLAYGLEDTSRLGCQICLTKEMDNMVVRVPEGINDARDV